MMALISWKKATVDTASVPSCGIAITLMAGLLLLAACTDADAAAPPVCADNQIQLLPTPTRSSDPDLFQPPQPPAAETGGSYCPTPVATPTASDEATTYTVTDLTNLSLDSVDQQIAAAAIGDDMVAVAWLTDGDVYVALSRGGNHFQVRRVDAGRAVTLAFSRANRLHMAYEQDGQILYRAADAGAHPAAVAAIVVDSGRDPQLLIDALNWAHVLYERAGRLYQARHLSGMAWLTRYVTDGTRPSVVAFYNDQDRALFGMPAGAYWFGAYVAYQQGSAVRILRYLSWFDLWQQIATFPIASDKMLPGRPRLAVHFDAAGQSWLAAAWLVVQESPLPALPAYVPARFGPANPLFPDQIGNPDQIHHGLNAARIQNDALRPAPFAGGLYQTFSVAGAGATVTARAWGIQTGGAQLRVGLDPAGGRDPNANTVQWSGWGSPTELAQLVSYATAAGSRVTLFLDTRLDAAGQAVTVTWDNVTLGGGALVNADFEESFLSDASGRVPQGWTAYTADAGYRVDSPRATYTVEAAWSGDGGATWSAVQPAAANRDASGSLTGALRPEVYPLLTTAMAEPTLALVYVYEAGDPPRSSDALRYGYLQLTRCTLPAGECAIQNPDGGLLAADQRRPGVALALARDPFNPHRALLAWETRQSDPDVRDIFATYLVLR